MIGSYDQQNTQPQAVEHVFRGQGGSATITQERGKGATLTRTGTGAYRLTWSESPGTFVAARAQLAAATPGDLAGHTVIFDTYDTTNLRLDFVVYNSAFAAHDLAANEYVDVFAMFTTTAVEAA